VITFIQKWSVLFLSILGVGILFFYINLVPTSSNTGKTQTLNFKSKICYQHNASNIQCQDCHRISNEPNSIAKDIFFQINPHSIQNIHQKCIQCHEHSSEYPLTPHNLNISGEETKCTDCHFEHLGYQIKPIIKTSGECIQCHNQKSEQFSDIHTNSAFNSAETIPWNFSHINHKTLHFKKSEQTFNCESCHTVDEYGNMDPIQFETSCTSCHQHTNQIQQNRLILIQLPGIDYDVLIDENINIGEWPMDAGIDLETSLNESLIPYLSVEGRDAYQILLDEDIDFIDLIDGADFALELEIFIWDVKRMLLDLTQPSIIQQFFGFNNKDDIEFIRKLILDWFPNLENEVELYQSGDIPETAIYEDYSTNDDSINQLHKSGFDFNISYQTSYHKDPILKEIYTHQYPQLESMLTLEQPGNCLKCHSIIRDKIDWDVSTSLKVSHPLIKQFSHTTHLKENKCDDCHLNNESHFEPISVQSCASCHHQSETNNTCTECHTYHPIQKEHQ